MSKLYITQKYYDKFLENKVINMLHTYGYKDREDYFNKIIKYLNDKYIFLNIDSLKIMDHENELIYSMYNGFIKGEFDNFDEIIVSFSDPVTKEGNTIISQQVMPMLQQRISNNLDFLYNKRIKKIFLLTSHKSTVFDASKNTIKEDSRGSTLQLLVRCLITLGFDVYPFIPINNLKLGPKFNNVGELVADIEYIKGQNRSNLQYNQIEIVDNKVKGSFPQVPKGQDEKYFAIRYLTAIMLNNHNQYDVSQAYMISGKSQMMEMLFKFANYVQSNDIICESLSEISDKEFISLICQEDDFLNKIKKLAEQYGQAGTRNITTNVRLSEVQKHLRKKLIIKQGCKCLLCNTTTEELLIASHIKDASECNIYEKADLDNVLLLCAGHDKLFDKKYITFSYIDGSIQISNKLTKDEVLLYNLNSNFHLPDEMLTEKRREYLIWHYNEFSDKNKES